MVCNYVYLFHMLIHDISDKQVFAYMPKYKEKLLHVNSDLPLFFTQNSSSRNLQINRYKIQTVANRHAHPHPPTNSQTPIFLIFPQIQRSSRTSSFLGKHHPYANDMLHQHFREVESRCTEGSGEGRNFCRTERVRTGHWSTTAPRVVLEISTSVLPGFLSLI